MKFTIEKLHFEEQTNMEHIYEQLFLKLYNKGCIEIENHLNYGYKSKSYATIVNVEVVSNVELRTKKKEILDTIRIFEGGNDKYALLLQEIKAKVNEL